MVRQKQPLDAIYLDDQLTLIRQLSSDLVAKTVNIEGWHTPPMKCDPSMMSGRFWALDESDTWSIELGISPMRYYGLGDIVRLAVDYETLQIDAMYMMTDFQLHNTMGSLLTWDMELSAVTLGRG